MTRQAFVTHKKRVLVFWSPKAGNSSLASWFLRATMPTQQMERLRKIRADADQGQVFPSILLQIGSIVPFDLARELTEKLEFDSFVLCRDPYQRAVSAYWDKVVKQHRIFRPMGAEGFSQGLCTDIAGPNWDARGISFREYLEHVGQRIGDRANGEPKLDHHFSTQVPFAFSDFTYANVMKLESINTDIEILKKRFRTDVDFPHVRRQDLSPETADVDLSDVSSAELARFSSSPSRQQFLTSVPKTLIAEAYDIDFNKLGYAK